MQTMSEVFEGTPKSAASSAVQMRFSLERFEPPDATKIAEWVETDEELHWLAPNTSAPLTAEKVIAWKKPRGVALVARTAVDRDLIGYAELNPMKNETAHLWIGHVIVHPQWRGGTGQAFVRALVGYAFEHLGGVRISLVVFPKNRVAIRCYRRIGFLIAGDEYHAFGTSNTRQRLLRLELNAAPSVAMGKAGRGGSVARTWSQSLQWPLATDPRQRPAPVGSLQRILPASRS